MEVDHGELMALAAGYIRSHPANADTVAAWLAWSLPRAINACEPSQDQLTSYAAWKPTAMPVVRDWAQWCRQRAETTVTASV